MTASQIEVLCCAASEIESALSARYEDLLSEDELTRWRSFRSATAATEFLVGRALLRTALAEKLNCDPRELQFMKNADGKPSLSQPISPWQFNLTHSHDWIALALCEGASVGVDIESYARRNNLHAIARRFFSEAENACLAQCTNKEWSDYFFAIWTLKEAHAKALGCGLPKILPCSSIAIDLTTGSVAMELSGAAYTAEKIFSWWYKLDENCALALIAHGEDCGEPKIFRCVPLQPRELFAVETRARGMRT